MYVLLADTPVAGTVNRIANWLTEFSGVQTLSLVRRNYKHNAFRVESGVFESLPNWRMYVEKTIREADAVFFHNVFSADLLEIAFNVKKPTCKFFYQYHSPPLEPPAYFYEPLEQYSFDGVLAVAQGYGRFHKSAICVPNIVPDCPNSRFITKEKIMFIPHMRSTNYRWSGKYLESDEIYLNQYRNLFKDYSMNTVKTVFGRDVVTHEEILFYMQTVSVVIDDIHTGLFHQTSMEALKAGCVVFSGADLLSQEEFCIAADCDPLPFLNVNGVEEIVQFMSSRSRDKEFSSYMEQSKNYAEKYLTERRLAKKYWEHVEPLLRS